MKTVEGEWNKEIEADEAEKEKGTKALRQSLHVTSYAAAYCSSWSPLRRRQVWAPDDVVMYSMQVFAST